VASQSSGTNPANDHVTDVLLGHISKQETDPKISNRLIACAVLVATKTALSFFHILQLGLATKGRPNPLTKSCTEIF